MPLPTKIGFLDESRTQRTAKIRGSEREGSPTPSAEYHPTMVPVKCKVCRSEGIAEFVNGFNLQDGDKLMAGRPIMGICLRCRKETELVPIRVMSPESGRELRLQYDIRRALEEAAKRGERIGESGVVWPLARVRLYEQYLERRNREA